MYKTSSEVVIGLQPWMKERRHTRMTIKDYQKSKLNKITPLAKGYNFGKIKKNETFDIFSP